MVEALLPPPGRGESRLGLERTDAYGVETTSKGCHSGVTAVIPPGLRSASEGATRN